MKYKLSQYILSFKNPKDKKEVILFNTLSGGIASLSNEEARKLRNKNLCFSELKGFEPLIEEGFLVPQERNEYKYIKHNEFLFQQDFYRDNYLSYVIAPTTACNLRCKYCFESCQDSKVSMSEETVNQIVKFIINDVERLNAKRVSIVWFGGEPLLCFDKITKLGSDLKKHLENINVEFTSRIISNGILLTKTKVEELVKNCNLTTAQITLDGLEKEYCERKKASKENYKQVINNIVEMANLIDVNIRLNVDKLNVKDMQELANLLYIKNGLNKKAKIYFSQLRDYNGDDKEHKIYFTDDEYAKEKIKFDRYLEEINVKPTKKGVSAIPQYKPIYCALSHTNNYAIGPEGELYKCEHYFGIKERVVGDVWNGLYYNDEYFKHINGVQNSICEKCALYPVCQSTCPETFKLIKFIDDKKCNRYDKIIKMLKRIVVENLNKTDEE